MSVAKGRCLCGAVEYAVEGPLRAVVYCHCTMCRRSTGHYLAATACAPFHLRLASTEHLRWYQSSAQAQRSFCDLCGSNLFWKPADGTRICIAAGTLDGPTGLRGVAHIHVEDKGDYYELDDGLAQHLGGVHGVPMP